MADLDQDTFERYQKALARDPRSKLFAPLAEAYRERGLLEGAEQMSRDGIRNHPDYVGGYTVLSKVLMQLGRHTEALEIVEKALSLSPENLLAYQLLADISLELKNPKRALSAHKMVLFLNPLSEKSRRAVEKLENLSADEYEQDLFQFQKFRATTSVGSAPKKSPQLPPADELIRQFGLIDALIVRQDLPKARELLEELIHRFPHHAGVQKRKKLLEMPDQESENIDPLVPRKKTQILRKIQILEKLISLLPR